MDLVKHLRKSVTLADKAHSNLDIKLILERDIKGQSGVKNMCLLNNLCSVRLNYLEIGLLEGLSFGSAIMGNNVNAFGIDNWSEFGGSPEKFKKNMEVIPSDSDVTIIGGDCFSSDVIDELEFRLCGDKVDVYYYDGGHSYDDHYNALVAYEHLLADEFIFIVDDWMQLDVQRGTLFSIRDGEYEILWEKHCESVKENVVGWWCGTYVAVLRKRC